MSKEVIVLSYEGRVHITGVGQTSATKALVEYARLELQEVRGKEIAHLHNVEVITEEVEVAWRAWEATIKVTLKELQERYRY